MLIQNKTLVRLRELINEETEYRSGPALVRFFNELGFSDVYGKGFPSRWVYTEGRLGDVNGTSTMTECIERLFAPINFINNEDRLSEYISDFNKYLKFDGWKVVLRRGKAHVVKNDGTDRNENEGIDEFLGKDFGDTVFDVLGVEPRLVDILKMRIDEIQKAIAADAPLASIFLSGSTLEGILLGVARKYPAIFNASNKAPRDKEGKVLRFTCWKLGVLIDVAHDAGFLKEDVRKFSHVLREFRNYIHPMQQMEIGFSPDMYTARICLQVLRAAIFQVGQRVVG